MQLSNLLQPNDLLPKEAERTIGRLITDSRKIAPGDLFIALRGAHVDGSSYIEEAIRKKASAVLLEASLTDEKVRYENNIPLIPIHKLKERLGEIAARYYDYPAKKLRVIGVTGTNGKTSCTYFLAQMLNAFGIRCGIIGTLGSGFYGDLRETGFTTPDAITLQSILHQFVQQGAQAIAMEVSSHSIHQGRINGVEFETAVFTNLTQDHLDYHGTMENYAAEKYRFLATFPVENIVINTDDPYGASWLPSLQKHPKTFSYSQKRDAHNSLFDLQGIKTAITTPWGEATLHLPIIGEFNLSNALAVIYTLCLMGFPLPAIAEKMQRLEAVPGRMQTVSHVSSPLIVVDFAHTPDAIEKVLQTLRPQTRGKLICVFGCGGDRDQGKRPLMGAMVEKYADIAIITNDNPRHESPDAIANDILQGFLNHKVVHIELDRSKAIQKSIQLATVDDCILIAGKGAERYQQMGDKKHPFSDVGQALLLLKSKNR